MATDMDNHNPKNNSSINDELLSRQDVADWLSVSVMSVIRLEHRGLLHPVVLGPRMIRYRKSEVAELVRRLSRPE